MISIAFNSTIEKFHGLFISTFHKKTIVNRFFEFGWHFTIEKPLHQILFLVVKCWLSTFMEFIRERKEFSLPGIKYQFVLMMFSSLHSLSSDIFAFKDDQAVFISCSVGTLISHGNLQGLF